MDDIIKEVALVIAPGKPTEAPAKKVKVKKADKKGEAVSESSSPLEV